MLPIGDTFSPFRSGRREQILVDSYYPPERKNRNG